MADEFIDIGIETDEQTLADGAVDQLRTVWVGWEPNEGDMEVIQIEALAPMAVDAATTASRMPAAAFREILQRLHGVTYTLGASATTSVLFELSDTDPHVIPAGTEIDVDGFAFTVDSDVITPEGASAVGGVAITAADPGVAPNGLAGDNVVMISSVAFVASVALDAPPAGGSDAETDADFQDRGSRELELQAKTLVTTRDYELMALSKPFVGRVVALSDTATRQMTVIASDLTGGVLTAPQKTELEDELETYRLSNWTLALEDATTTTIGVSYEVHPYPGYVSADLLARADAELELFLDPATWGRPREIGDVRSTRWLLEPTVRKNKIIDLLGDVEGVDYVGDVTLSGSAGSLQPNGDWLMPGTVPLASPGVIAGTVI